MNAASVTITVSAVRDSASDSDNGVLFGCFSSVALGAVGVITLLGAAIVLRKKEDK